MLVKEQVVNAQLFIYLLRAQHWSVHYLAVTVNNGGDYNKLMTEGQG